MAVWTRRPGIGLVPRADPRAAWLLIDGHELAATLVEVDGAGATVATTTRLPIGARATLRHVAAGTLPAEIAGIEQGRLRLRFDRDARAIGFALAVAAADAAERHRDAA